MKKAWITLGVVLVSGPLWAVTASIQPNRTSGVAPLAVLFDAQGTTNLTGNDMLGANFSWAFGEPLTGNWPYSGRPRNEATGFFVGHVFETPGVYTIVLTVTDTAGASDTEQVTITVLDPDRSPGGEYLGTNTRCVSRAGDFMGAPSGAELVTSTNLAAQWAWVNGGVNRRLLFRRGETWPGVSVVTLSGGGPRTVGAFGPAGDARPRFVLTGSAQAIVTLAGQDWRMMDLDVDGSGLGGAQDVNNLSLDGLNNLVLRIYSHNSGWVGLGMGGDDAVVADSEIVENGYFSIYSDGTGDAILGSRIDQLRAATAGVGNPDPNLMTHNVHIAHNHISASRPTPTTGIKAHSRRTVITDNVIVAGTSRIALSSDDGTGTSPTDLGMGNYLIERNILRPETSGPHMTENNNYISGGVMVGPHQGVMVRNNLILDMSNAVTCPPGERADLARNVRILHNTVRVNQYIGLNRGEGDFMFFQHVLTGWEVRNNVVHAVHASPPPSGTKFINLVTRTGVQFSNNLYYNEAANNLVTTDGQNRTIAQWMALAEPGSFQADPLLASSDPASPDFLHILPGSPAVDAATASPVLEDYLRVSRPQGVASDIGAFEGAGPADTLPPARPRGLRVR